MISSTLNYPGRRWMDGDCWLEGGGIPRRCSNYQTTATRGWGNYSWSPQGSMLHLGTHYVVFENSAEVGIYLFIWEPLPCMICNFGITKKPGISLVYFYSVVTNITFSWVIKYYFTFKYNKLIIVQLFLLGVILFTCIWRHFCVDSCIESSKVKGEQVRWAERFAGRTGSALA